MIIDIDLNKLIENLKFFIRKSLYSQTKKELLIEIVMDLGRRPEIRFSNRFEYLSQQLISWQDLDFTIKRIGNFSTDNRAGIDQTLHRISCIRNREFIINGLTCRIGRTLCGTVNGIRDLLETEKSIIILGKPGVGKTTTIREISRVLSEERKKRVIIIDTSNEIAGDTDIPHIGIGKSRRMQVSKTEFQHQVMIEAIENHMPEVIIIDEIGTELEAIAARTISERGVQLVGTAHGNCLESLIKNPLLSDLVGGIQYVTLSDEEARRRATKKSILERKAYPAFQLGIEINERQNWNIYENITDSVDLILQNNQPLLQRRHFFNKTKTDIRYNYLSNLLFLNSTSGGNLKKWKNLPTYPQKEGSIQHFKSVNITVLLYSISPNLIEIISKKRGIEIMFTREIKQATLILGLKSHIQKNKQFKKIIKINKIPVYIFKKITINEITKILDTTYYKTPTVTV